jgi:hypothetical protein
MSTKIITGEVVETLTVSKAVEVEVPEDADEATIEQAIRSEAYKETVSDGTGWEILSSQSTDVAYWE